MIFLVLLLGLILRSVALDQSLWLDEAINVLALKSNNLFSLLTQYPRFDFHPPGYFLFLWLWTKLVGFSEISVRTPSTFFGLLTIWVTYLIGKKLVSKRFGLLASLLLAINPLHIYYSQEARPYALAAFSVCLSFYFFLRFMLDEKKALLGLALSSLLVLISDYLAFFVIPTQILFCSFTQPKKKIGQLLISLLPTLIVGLIWLPFFIPQLNNGLNTAKDLPGWKAVVGGAGLKPVGLTFVKFIIGRIGLANKQLYAMLFIPIGLVFTWILFQGIKKTTSKGKILVWWLLTPLVLISVVSFFIPVFDYFRVLFLLPAFTLLIGLGLDSNSSNTRIILSSIVLSTFVICSGIYLTQPFFQREDWRGLSKFIKETSEPVILESNGNFAPLDYYLGSQKNLFAGLKSIPALSAEAVSELNLVSFAQRVYLVNYLVEITDPKRLIAAKLANLGYKQSKIYNFNGVGFVYEYTKDNH